MDTPTKPLIAVDAGLSNALWANFVAPVLDGTHGLVEEMHLGVIESLPSLFPVGSVTAELRLEHQRMAAAVGDDWAAIAAAWVGRSGATVTVRAGSAEALAKAVATVRSNAPAAEAQANEVRVDFWQSGRGGVYTTARSIAADAWSDIEPNYPADVAAALARAVEHSPTPDGGRIILWHGPPGTGKTTAIRSLAREWAGWARFQVVLDPDPIVGSAASLMHVLLDDEDDAEWRVLVIEDADPIVRTDSWGGHLGASTTLSRLLNVGDGIVGQGTKVLVLLTTNERPERLHPALCRPGRCLSSVHFRRFTRAEARRLTGDRLPEGETFSLAELKGRAPEEPIASMASVRVGQYL